MKQAKLLIAPLLAFALTGCMTDNDKSSNKNPDPDPVVITPVVIDLGVKSSDGATYREEGLSFITTDLQDTSIYCNDTTLVSAPSNPQSDTIAFTVSGDTLTGSGELESLESEAVIRPTSIFTRVDTGSGLEGAWRFKEFSYKLVSGTLSDEEKAANAEAALSFNKAEAFNSTILQFKDGAISSYSNGNTAEQFIREWNTANQIVYDDGTTISGPADSAMYDITLKMLDKNTVELKGDKTSEKVTIKISANGDVTYKSDKAGHAEYTYYNDAKICPNFEAPEWFTEFKTDNESAIAALVKTGNSRAKRGYAYKFRLFPSRI